MSTTYREVPKITPYDMNSWAAISLVLSPISGVLFIRCSDGLHQEHREIHLCPAFYAPVTTTYVSFPPLVQHTPIFLPMHYIIHEPTFRNQREKVLRRTCRNLLLRFTSLI